MHDHRNEPVTDEHGRKRLILGLLLIFLIIDAWYMYPAVRVYIQGHPADPALAETLFSRPIYGKPLYLRLVTDAISREEAADLVHRAFGFTESGEIRFDSGDFESIRPDYEALYWMLEFLARPDRASNLDDRKIIQGFQIAGLYGVSRAYYEFIRELPPERQARLLFSWSDTERESVRKPYMKMSWLTSDVDISPFDLTAEPLRTGIQAFQGCPDPMKSWKAWTLAYPQSSILHLTTINLVYRKIQYSPRGDWDFDTWINLSPDKRMPLLHKSAQWDGKCYQDCVRISDRGIIMSAINRKRKPCHPNP